MKKDRVSSEYLFENLSGYLVIRIFTCYVYSGGEGKRTDLRR